MLNLYKDPVNLCINKIDFNFENIVINDIPVKFLTLREQHNKNIGELLEQFRVLGETKMNETEFEYISDEVDKCKLCTFDFNPSHNIILKSKYEDITSLIIKLSQKILSKFPDCSSLISDCFKKESLISITKIENITDEFLEGYTLDKDLLEGVYISNLLIIDDVFNKGRTINQLLIRLAQNNNINNNSSIFIYTIYSLKVTPFDNKKLKDLIFGGHIKPFDEQ